MRSNQKNKTNMKQIRPELMVLGIKPFLKKLCDSQGSKEIPLLTIVVGYKHEGGYHQVFFTEKDDETTVEACKNLLKDMVTTKKISSKDCDKNHGCNIGAIRSEEMIVVIAGIENTAAKVIIAAMLHKENILSKKEYGKIKKHLAQKDLFKTVEK
jgi:hypothetical protein